MVCRSKKACKCGLIMAEHGHGGIDGRVEEEGCDGFRSWAGEVGRLSVGIQKQMKWCMIWLKKLQHDGLCASGRSCRGGFTPPLVRGDSLDPVN